MVHSREHVPAPAKPRVHEQGPLAPRLRTALVLLVALGSVALPGCAVLSYDKQTGTQHLYGIGHLRMRTHAVEDRINLAATGIQTVGLTFGTTQEGAILSFGWQDLVSVRVVNPNAALVVERPAGGLFNLHVDSKAHSGAPYSSPPHSSQDQK